MKCQTRFYSHIKLLIVEPIRLQEKLNSQSYSRSVFWAWFSYFQCTIWIMIEIKIEKYRKIPGKVWRSTTEFSIKIFSIILYVYRSTQIWKFPSSKRGRSKSIVKFCGERAQWSPYFWFILTYEIFFVSPPQILLRSLHPSQIHMVMETYL